ncbi:MAG: TonB-dependent receptor, partial [Pseudomonadota bacterium]|nr:TonB-dependent receptor [Pseudomonadota bacterium]
QAIEEITVTATKRSASMQDIPLAVQAMDSQQLEDQNIQSFSDYVKHLPSVNAGGRGPGQNEIYIRGAAVDAINITVAESQGSAPNVALYLDEQPVTAGGRNLDVYVTDMERIEVLPGPQGTLYGASSMAGTVRLITNKPNLDEFQASWTGSYSRTNGGEASNNVEAMINIPIVEGKMAFRAALYNDNQGGYIDNVPGTFTASKANNPTYPGDSVTYQPGHRFFDGTSVPDWVTTTELDPTTGVITETKSGNARIVPVHYTTVDNSSTAEDDFNDAHYAGARFGLKWALNDNWDLLVQNTQQSLKTEGVWDYDLAKGDLKVSRFTPDKLDDSFSQTAWTLEGSIGDIDIVYTGAYLDRQVEQQLDYTGYTNIGAFISGYQCEYLTGSYYTGAGVGETLAVAEVKDADGNVTTAAVAAANTVPRYVQDPTLSGDPGVIECGDPSSGTMLDNEMTRLTNELRFSTNWDGIVNMAGGIFNEDFEIKHIGDFNYNAPYQEGWAPIDINSSSTFANSPANARGVTTAATQFRNDNLREESQTALFGEINFQLSDELNVAVGARKYDLDYTYRGYGAWRYGNKPILVDDGDPDNDVRPTKTGGRDYGTNFTGLNPLNTEDTMMKFTLSYTPDDNNLFYATFSEGYRPGGFNRAAAKAGKYNASANNTANGGALVCGTKAAIGANASTGFPGYCLPYVFRSDTMENTEFGWKSTMLDGRLRFNGSIYMIDWKDIQVSQFDSQNISILTVVDNGGDAEIKGMEGDIVYAMTDNFTLYAAGSFNDTELVKVDPAFAVVVQDEGRELPLTPETQFSIRGRYEWETANGDAYAQMGIKHASKALNSIVDTKDEPNTYQKAYTIVDMATGIRNVRNNWGMELYVQNLGDERAQLHINRQDFFERVTVNRPRTVGLRISYDF